MRPASLALRLIDKTRAEIRRCRHSACRETMMLIRFALACLVPALLLAACSESVGGSSGAGGSTAGTSTPCASEDDCFGMTSHCDTARGVCTGCSTDDDCRGSLKCDTATGICRDCVTDADCFPTAPLCDAVSGQC